LLAQVPEVSETTLRERHPDRRGQAFFSGTDASSRSALTAWDEEARRWKESGPTKPAQFDSPVADGQSLPASLRDSFGHGLGADLSQVRVHTDPDAAAAAVSVSARAFAIGQDIFFADGAYDPGSAAGQHLIAHEVAHTVQQQGAAASTQFKLDESQLGDALETEADRAADALMSGGTAPALSRARAQISRDTGGAKPDKATVFPIPSHYPQGEYLLLFDPLDGSSNIDVNVPVGTIFSVLRKTSSGTRGEMSDLLQPGHAQVAAGYVIYGSSTMLVYTTGQGAHGFTLDPSIGEFLLSHPNIRIPDAGRYLSVNDSYEQLWDENVKTLMRCYRGLERNHKALSVRYVGSLVADFHRNLLGGGVFAYPANTKRKQGKLRLLYEANPLAFIVEQAGGAAYDGVHRVMDVHPTELHQRTPLYIGSKREVDLATELLSGVTAGVGG